MFDFQQLAVDVGLKQLKLLLEESVAPAVYQDGVESDHAAVVIVDYVVVVVDGVADFDYVGASDSDDEGVVAVEVAADVDFVGVDSVAVED